MTAAPKWAWVWYFKQFEKKPGAGEESVNIELWLCGFRTIVNAKIDHRERRDGPREAREKCPYGGQERLEGSDAGWFGGPPGLREERRWPRKDCPCEGHEKFCDTDGRWE